MGTPAFAPVLGTQAPPLTKAVRGVLLGAPNSVYTDNKVAGLETANGFLQALQTFRQCQHMFKGYASLIDAKEAVLALMDMLGGDLLDILGDKANTRRSVAFHRPRCPAFGQCR